MVGESEGVSADQAGGGDGLSCDGEVMEIDVKPMDVGLKLQAALFEGDVYEPSVLAIDEDLIYSQMTLAASQAFNLSVNAVIFTKDTAAPLIEKAAREARGLAIEADVYAKDVIDAIIGKAYRESYTLQSMVGGK